MFKWKPATHFRFRNHWPSALKSKEQWRRGSAAEVLCSHQQSAFASQVPTCLLSEEAPVQVKIFRSYANVYDTFSCVQTWTLQAWQDAIHYEWNLEKTVPTSTQRLEWHPATQCGKFKKRFNSMQMYSKHTQQKHSAVFYSTHQHTSNSYKMKKGRKAYHVGQLWE